jgi:hypothetical protein
VTACRWLVAITLGLALYVQVRRVRRLDSDDVEQADPEEPSEISPSPA